MIRDVLEKGDMPKVGLFLLAISELFEGNKVESS